MNLKKINPNLQKALIENSLTEPTALQQESFSAIKSGADVIYIDAPGSGKSMAIALNVLQRLEKPIGESTRALVLVEDKEKVLEMVALFKTLGNYMDLRVFGVHDKGDIDFDKNQISLGLDILIGTPNRINQMFSSAGFNLNTIKMFVVDDADLIFKSRLDSVILRLSASIEKTQYLFFASELTEKVDIVADKIMIEPYVFEIEE
ncbi:DEAD/DEAH box helicase [Flavobacterium sp. CYK-4]|uniref:DEAD/DEAH box helicase n=1 Tax=Flavobacterium lotistagni TaxID=2709660 RepID=UPI0014099C2E|nr:DEAD/DEAH box helicase [Flavobacterium lotistagni]NHM06304.1 DEAD/DEAH box helicase [Flavobacterium lotistagni]